MTMYVNDWEAISCRCLASHARADLRQGVVGGRAVKVVCDFEERAIALEVLPVPDSKGDVDGASDGTCFSPTRRDVATTGCYSSSSSVRPHSEM